MFKEICTVDYKTFGQNIRRLRVTQGFRQEDLAEKCGCTTSHIGQIENGRVKPSLEMTVRIANALNATTDQLLAHEFSHPEEIYLKEIAKRIEKYPVSKRRLALRRVQYLFGFTRKVQQNIRRTRGYI